MKIIIKSTYGDDLVKIIKKLFGRKKKKAAEQEKKQEPWYNNAHENGASVITPGDLSNAGSNNSFENGITQFNARR